MITKRTINLKASSQSAEFLHQYLQAGHELELLRHDVHGGRLSFFLALRHAGGVRLRRFTHFHLERRRRRPRARPLKIIDDDNHNKAFCGCLLKHLYF